MEITAIIPTFNTAAWIAAAIDSVLAQTHPVREIIIIDDGSSDNTREIVAGYSDRVRYIYQENAGPSIARNRAIREASCPWIAFLDADDCWLPEKLARQVQAAETDPSAILVYTSRWHVTPDGARELVRVVDPKLLWPALRFRNPIAPSTVLIRRDALLEVGGFDETLTGCEDWALWAKLAWKRKFLAVDDPLVLYRILPTNRSRDYMRDVRNTEKMASKYLLEGLSGWGRFAWRRRGLAAALSRAAWMAYEAGAPDEIPLLCRSLLVWPSPFFYSKRWKMAVRRLLYPSKAGTVR
jgi:glycosyltransferase involved in cell wall biosynthesis